MYKASDEQHKYLEQWERIKRWYKRIKRIEESCPQGYIDDDCLDEVYAFFMNCYHLKDWLKNSIFKQNNTKRQEVENIFDEKKGKEIFKVCADFVNGVKHVKADRFTRIDPNTQIEKQHVTIRLGNPLPLYIPLNKNGKKENEKYSPPSTQYSWEIKCGNKYYNVYQLVEDCLKEWENFLKKEKLI